MASENKEREEIRQPIKIILYTTPNEKAIHNNNNISSTFILPVKRSKKCVYVSNGSTGYYKDDVCANIWCFYYISKY